MGTNHYSYESLEGLALISWEAMPLLYGVIGKCIDTILERGRYDRKEVRSLATSVFRLYEKRIQFLHDEGVLFQDETEGIAENSVQHSVSKNENESKHKSILPWFLELLLPVIGGLKIDEIKYLLPTL